LINFENINKYFSYDKNNLLQFNSGFFLIIFTLFILLYAFIYKQKVIRTLYVIIFSLYFYYKTSGDFLIILTASVVINFFISLLIDKTGKRYLRVLLFVFSLMINLATLSYFKYANFLIDNLNLLFNGKFQQVEIFLPIGISFFTFQTIAYLTDVFRNNIKPAKNFLDYTFFISFFPYIVAGPIMRARDMLPQIQSDTKIEKEDISFGLYSITKGLIKKAILAYYISQYCDIVYGMPGNYSGFENIFAMYGYMLQIYLDFSGYTDIALGISRLMGFKISINFNEPYKSHNISEFWQRWHISLSKWLRDYLFLPISYFYLRHSKNKKISVLNSYIIATIITMLIAGLWHGAANKFIFWGGIHGLALITNRMYLYFVKKKNHDKYMPKWLGWFITFHLVAVLWIFFRAGSFQEAIESINSIIFNFDFAYTLPFITVRYLFLIFLFIGFISVFLSTKLKERLKINYYNYPLVIQGIIFIIVLQLIIQIQAENVQPFIYFQF
jgi:alginate O-acetyltransferase complex protein AlgI